VDGADKQRVWLHDIVAKSKPTRGSFRAGRTRCAWILVIKKMPGTRAGQGTRVGEGRGGVSLIQRMLDYSGKKFRRKA
jgi:hypothetical protein